MSSPGTLESEVSVQDRELFAKWKWVGLIVGLLSIQVIVGGMAIFLANSDPAHSVVPNYHQQALEYDKVLAARQLSHQLGWTWSIVPGQQIDTTGKRQLTLQLQDNRAQPVTEAHVILQLLHHARGNSRQNITLTPVPQKPGWYQGEAVVDRAGLWQVDLSVDRQKEHFVDRREFHWSLGKP
ncbi:MAG: FixH family protein [Gemmatales bacterium]